MLNLKLVGSVIAGVLVATPTAWLGGSAPVAAPTLVAERPAAVAPLGDAALTYAQSHNVTTTEAERRIDLVFSMEDAMSRVENLFGDRYAGSWISNTDDFKLVIRMTSGLPIPALHELLQSMSIPVRVVYGT